MCKVVTLLRQQLAENGFTRDLDITRRETEDIVLIEYQSKGVRSVDEFTITTGNESPPLEKQVARVAECVVQNSDASQYHNVVSDEAQVLVTDNGDLDVVCNSCGSFYTVSKRDAPYYQQGEVTTPQPTPSTSQEVLNTLDSHTRASLEAYLYGKMKTVCTCVHD